MVSFTAVKTVFVSNVNHLWCFSILIESPGLPFGATPVRIAKPIGEGVEARIGSSDSNSDYLGDSSSSSEGPHGDEYIPETPSVGRPQYIMPAPHPIPSLADVPCFYQQVDLDTMQIK
ncbi:hypothetical protein PIB30_023679 [Stylosanthes scabra]|uniref:Uncharacterized protein n=1 Tax=Stylosanthes scabra TaxID=79078 RepID=A0ABU6T989_9FABA|nr:hypothetical protein [Stylosanthes scabra]